MKRCPSVEDLAMYAGRDCEPAAMADTREHLAVCGKCRVLVAAFENDRELLGIPPVLSDEAVIAIHDGVIGRLRNQRRRRYASVAAAAAAVLILAWLSPLSLRKAGSPAPRQTSAGHLPSPAVESGSRSQVTNTRIAGRNRHKRIRSPRAQQADNEGLLAALDDLLAIENKHPPAFSGSVVVTLQTQDPNVTIILLEESSGGAE
jgi:hypothetical protein